jgi:Tfp pilus assembly protein PilF
VRALLLPLPLILTACGSAPVSKSASAAPTEISASTRNMFAAGTAAMKAQKWSEAEAQFKQLLQAEPNLSGAHLNLALIYDKTNRPADADAQFKQAIQANPDNAEARDQYGIWLRTQGRFKDAENIYLQTLQRQPARADTHLNLGILYDLYLGKPAQAVEHYEQYLALKGDDASPEVGRVKNWVADIQRRSKAGG